ncbi:hypothetical protein GCK72_020452 [Caenorhabditis remanei]|uniref:Uncharacterized protein n=1 Tax=Caenorhabditis remanei TaxID=31234 RepID=A0A6A5GH47_CAERE|nr:hypothetical protein GCK72_020452 [Caenorhabditis remanei]KAF1753895.1 hypothetical protein GCK72_020452 [Caenorhabditis remanei]
MYTTKLFNLGILILAAEILNLVGVFSPCWTSESDQVGMSFCYGIVPYDSINSSIFPWYAASSWLMFITVAFSIITILAYFKVQADVIRDGYSCGSRKWFIIISVCAMMTVLLTISAITVLGVNFSKLSVYYISYNLGYSAWISISAAVFYLIASGLSAHISYRDCC